MAKFNIEFNEEECIGCGACAAQCPENWDMKEDEDEGTRKAEPLEFEIEDLSCNELAANVCPVGAINIVKK
ncbi:MAG: ferredoxin [archaeon]